MEYPNDKMTGLPGSAALKDEIEKRIERQEQFAVAVIDVDRCAYLNHDFHHTEGDRVLVRLAELLAQAGAGTVYRTGGDKFTLVMPQMTLEQALVEAARLRALVSEYNFALPDGRSVTITAGVAHAPYYATMAQLLGAAAAALLDGKREAYLRREALRPA